MSDSIRVLISGLGQISAVGAGRAALEQGLSGERQPNIPSLPVVTAAGIKNIPVYRAPEVLLPAHVPESIKRRMPRLAKMFYAAVSEAIEDSFGEQRTQLKTSPERTGLVVGTAFGCLEVAAAFEQRLVREGPSGASPTLFAGSIQNSLASHLSISFGLQGPAMTITTMEQTTMGAFRVAYDWLKDGLVDHVIVAIGDEASEFHAYAMAGRAGHTAHQVVPKEDSVSSIIGEGVCCFVLSRQGCSERHYAEITSIDLQAQPGPKAQRCFFAAGGCEDQWSRYRAWFKTLDGTLLATAQCHAGLYGTLVTGSAFELAIAALKIPRDGQSTLCLQLTDQGEAQTLTLGSVAT